MNVSLLLSQIVPSDTICHAAGYQENSQSHNQKYLINPQGKVQLLQAYFDDISRRGGKDQLDFCDD